MKAPKPQETDTESLPSMPPLKPAVKPLFDCPSTARPVRPASPRAVCALALILAGALQAGALDLKDAVVVTTPGFAPTGNQAVVMLVDEVEKRSGVRWPTATHWPSGGVPVIAVGLKADAQAFAGPGFQSLPALPGPDGAEGYRLCVRKGEPNPAVYVLGNDLRGVLFGVGRLLRELHWGKGRVWADDDLSIATAPKYRLRGHQLGYRPKCNSYDAWDLPVWEQYFRDLAIFGCNAIELLPPHTDDDSYSPHFPRPQMEMMEGMSRAAASYGLDVWVWFPAMATDYTDPKVVENEVKEWGRVLSRLPRVDAVFVPGGDPGHTAPKVLMALLEKETTNLHRYHPKAGMWVSPQGFDQKWMNEFLDILRLEQPAWLAGVVYGPQVRMTLPRFRELIPAQYPIRHYPDITHTRQCEYTVPNWDVAYAVTEARECINPRPEDEAQIFRAVQPLSIGFISYSEGCNDDVNKFVWSALGWDPDMPVIDILRQYSHYFIGERYADDFAHGLLALEQDWRGPLMANQGVDVTLQQFQRMERDALPAVLRNWRFQQALYRAYYDAYVRHRLIYETGLEAQAMACLRNAPATGVAAALADAQRCLDQATRQRVNTDWRTRIYQLAEALFQSIGMQLSVDKYQAIAIDRGASLDTLDFPLNDRFWLEDRFAKIRHLSSRQERLAAIDEILR